VRVRGAPVAEGNDRVDYANLALYAPSAGTYDYALTSGGSFIRLGSAPDGRVTMDVKGDAGGGYVNTVAAIARRLMLKGIGASALKASSFSAMDVEFPGAAQAVFTEQITVEEAVSRIMAGAGGFWGDIGDGRLAVGRLTPAGGSAVTEYNEANIFGEVTPVPLPDAVNPCVWRQVVAYAVNNTPMSPQDIVEAQTALTEEQRTILQQPYKTAQFSDTLRRQGNPLAKSPAVLRSCFVGETAAETLADSLGALYAPGAKLYSFPTGSSAYGLRLGQTIRVKWPRHGLENGKNLRLAGLTHRGTQSIVMGIG
jgi:hypothetical protein